jgi:cobaltochelatase CobS
VVKVRDLFGVDSDMEVPAFSEADERVPDLDPTYVFDPTPRSPSALDSARTAG